MHLDRGAPEPLYRQLADLLRTQIQTGRLQPRTAIPSTMALAAEYGISPVTAKQAVDVLKREGLVRGVPGKGVYVAER